MKKIIIILSVLFSGILPAQYIGGITSQGSTPVNGLIYFDGTKFTSFANVVNACVYTDGSGVPWYSQTLPQAVQGNITTVGTIATGVWHGSVINSQYVKDSTIQSANSNLTISRSGGLITLNVVGGSGTVTSVGSGFGILGGPFTTSGTLFADTTRQIKHGIPTIFFIDSVLTGYAPISGSTLSSTITTSSLTSFGSSPTFITPILGTPTSGTLTNCTLPYSGLTGTVPTWNQNTTGSAGSVAAANITGTTLASNVTGSSLTSFGSSIALGTPGSGTLTNCTFPTLNQNTTGSAGSVAAANITGTTLASSVVTSSLTTVGTIGTGTWNGTTVAVAHGGTGRTAPNYYFLTVSAPGSITTSAIEALGLSHSLSPITTNSSDVLYICITGVWKNATVADAGTIGLYYDDAATAAAPANATAVSGITGITLVGTAFSLSSFGTASGGQGFCLQGIVHGLTSGHTYWVDLGVSSASSTVITVSDVNISINEL